MQVVGVGTKPSREEADSYPHPTPGFVKLLLFSSNLRLKTWALKVTEPGIELHSEPIFFLFFFSVVAYFYCLVRVGKESQS